MARDQSLDVARGAIMLYIVGLIHGVWWFNIFGLQRYGDLLLFEMPAVFAISGFGYRLFEASKKGGPAIAGPVDYFWFLATRISRILIPYFAYAIAAVAIVIAFKGHFHHEGWEPKAIALAWLDPSLAGGPFTIYYLNSHLWFIAPFLAVTALLPLAARLVPKAGLPLWAFAPPFAIAMTFLSRQHLPSQGMVQTIVFYLGWALFGYGLALKPQRSARVLAVTAAVAIATLVVLRSGFGITQNMYNAKFPPNGLFVVFSTAWMSSILLLLTRIPRSFVDDLAAKGWFLPFLKNGYSVYLWQGVAYSLASILRDHTPLSINIDWAIALVLSAAIGSLASPLERVRIRR